MRTGRPKLPEGTTVPAVVAVRMKPEEREAIELVASFRGCSVSEWAREVLAREARTALALEERARPERNTPDDLAKHQRAGELVLVLDPGGRRPPTPPAPASTCEELRASMLAATEAGVSVRAIARAAGMSATGLGRFMNEPQRGMVEENRARVALAIVDAKLAAAEQAAK